MLLFDKNYNDVFKCVKKITYNILWFLFHTQHMCLKHIYRQLWHVYVHILVSLRHWHKFHRP